MSDVAEEKLDALDDKLTEQHLEHEIEKVADDVAEEIEELKEEVQEAVETVLDRPPDLIVTPPPELDYDLLADKVAERISTPAPVEAEEPEVEEPETQDVTPDEPPGHNSFLYKKRT